MIFKLHDSILHTMDFYETCYYVVAIDDLVSDYMQDMLMKDELFELLEDNPLKDEVTDGEVRELQYLQVARMETTIRPEPPLKKVS